MPTYLLYKVIEIPYIKQDYRTKYNQAIKKMLIRFKAHEEKRTLDALKFDDILGKLSFKILCDVDAKHYDGEMNYFLTKLNKETGWLTGEVGINFGIYKAVDILRDAVVNFMLSVYHPNTYYDFNRMMGFCVCCIKEMKRRYGGRASMAMSFVGMVMDDIWEKLVPHEEIKMKENGDV